MIFDIIFIKNKYHSYKKLSHVKPIWKGNPQKLIRPPFHIFLFTHIIYIFDCITKGIPRLYFFLSLSFNRNPTWWKRRSSLERGLTVIAVCAVLVAAALAIGLGVVASNSEACEPTLTNGKPPSTLSLSLSLSLYPYPPFGTVTSVYRKYLSAYYDGTSVSACRDEQTYAESGFLDLASVDSREIMYLFRPIFRVCLFVYVGGRCIFFLWRQFI